MNITKEHLDDLNAVIKVNVEKDDYLPKVEDQVKKLRKQVTMKGFRKGHVPASVVKKMYGNQVLAEELNKLINENMTQYLQENDIHYLGNPLPKDQENIVIDINQPEDYEFEYELGLSPDFELKGLDDKLDKYKIKIDDKVIDEEVNNVRERLGEQKEVEAMEEGDVIHVKLDELDDKDMLKEGGQSNELPVSLDTITDKQAKKDIMQLKPGESLRVNLTTLTDRDRNDALHFFLNLHDDEEGHNHDHDHDHSDISDHFQLTLQKITRNEPAELNEELYKKVFGEETEVKTEEDFRKKVAEEIEKAYEQNTIQRLNFDIRKHLLEKNDIELPNDFLKRWIMASNEQPLTDEQLEEDYGNFADNLRWNLIVNKLRKENDIEVKEDEVKREMANMMLQQYGISADMLGGDDKLMELADKMMENKEQVQKTYEYLLDQKIFEHIRGQIALNEKEISLEDYNALS